MIKELKYGSGKMTLEFPAKAELLITSEPEYTIDKNSFLEDIKKHLPLDKQSYTNVAIIVSDKTRLCNYPEFLPWITETLENKGADPENITFYIAYGTHAKQTEEESLSSYGEIYSKYRFVHHDGTKEDELVYLGTTSRGTEVKIRKNVVESSLIITFGGISHHYFAGYGGGRKLIFPGVAARSSIYRNHSYFLDKRTKTLAENCQPGVLEGNPIAEDLKEIDDMLPQKISIHAILNSKGQVCNLLVGKNYDDFLLACKEHDSYYRSGSTQKYDLVIASSGGYPKDINFIQAHKSVHHAAAFVKDGGKLIVISECRDGIGSATFIQYLEMGGFEHAFEVLEQNYEGNGGTALSMMSKTSRVKIYLMTSLSTKYCDALKVSSVTQEQIQDCINQQKGTIAVIENASLLVMK